MPETVFDRFETPPAAKLLEWELLALDAEHGSIEVGFVGKPEFANPSGHIQGGFLTAMLDDAMGPAIVAMTDGALFGRTINLHTHFLRPVPIGEIRAQGRITKLGKTTAFLEGELFDCEGNLAARAVAAVSLAPI